MKTYNEIFKPAEKKPTPIRIHPGMADRTNTTLGAPTKGTPPDASSPLPTDHERQHATKVLARAEINPGCRSRNEDSLASENAGVAHARARANGYEALHALGDAVRDEARQGSREHASGLKRRV